MDGNVEDETTNRGHRTTQWQFVDASSPPPALHKIKTNLDNITQGLLAAYVANGSKGLCCLPKTIKRKIIIALIFDRAST